MEWKFEPFEKDSNQSKVKEKHSNDIRRKWMHVEEFDRDAKHSNANSKHSNEIRSTRMQIRTILKEF